MAHKTLISQTTYSERTSPLTQRERAVHYGGGYFVVAGTGGDFAYSADSVTWTKVTKFTNDVITSVCYGNGKWVAIDSGFKVWVTTNLDSGWSEANLSGIDLGAVCYASSRFWACGENGYMGYSEDGVNWVQVPTGVTYKFYDICYGDGLILAGGAGGAIITSPDGLTWTDRTNSAYTADWRGVGYGNGVYIAGGTGGLIIYSDDKGVTWKQASSNTTATVNYIRAFTAMKGKLYTVCYISTGKGEVWESVDGANWTVKYTASGRLWCIDNNGSTSIMSGDNGKIYAIEIDTSPDGAVFEIFGGADLINGTVYKKDYGKTLIGGTVYEVGFAPAEATVTITMLSGAYYTPQIHLWLEINGTKYQEISLPTEITVPIGTVIQCCFQSAYSNNKIYLNDTVIAEGMETYDYTVTGDISIQGGLNVTGGGMGSPGSISERYFKITEQ